jgi:two-component system OmpR family response regulator
VPVVLLTARDDETDRIIGLEMGADDYVTKPFSSRELLARINAVIRRTQMLPPNLQVSEAGRQLAFGDWRLDHRRHLLDAQDTAYPLSGAEFRLLRVFSTTPTACSAATAAQPHPGPRCRTVRPLDRSAGQPRAPAPGR